ncbi:MAG: hypothetical protein Q9179_001817 [Wetmoreana sp. 5 TL-2023]
MEDQTPSPSPSPHAFLETRADLEPLGQSSVVQIQLPSTVTSFSLTSRSQRHVVSTSAACSNEATFIRTCLASASSIYFSKSHKYPRSFLWRVLDNNKVLELRSIDLSKNDDETNEATVVLQFGFPSTIRKGGVALADNGEDVLSVFALMKSNELFTLTIQTRFFCDVAASEESPERWSKAFKPSTFTLSNPHRLIAGSPEQLVIALGDGRLLRLIRRRGEDGSTWQELAYNDGSWGSSLRGLVRWQGSNTVRYDGTVLDDNTAIAAAFSPSQEHLLTVCANHTLKIWNLEKGRNVFSMDLLGQQRGPQDIQRLMLEAGNPEILRVFEAEGAIEGDDYYAMTYSPHDGGQFKIWAIRDADEGRRGVRFLHSEVILRPPDPDPNPESKVVWKMADFKIGQGDRGTGMHLWVLMRSNKRYKTYNLKFDLEDLPAAWSSKWTSAASSGLGQWPLPQPVPYDARDAQDVWLEYLLYPGRYSYAMLETAVSIYCSARKLDYAIDAKTTLRNRVCSAIAAQAASQPVKEEEENGTHFAQYRTVMQQEWSLLYQELQDLDKMTWQVLTLAFDDRSDMPWHVFAGGCALVRECSRLEAISQNAPAVLESSIGLLETRSIEDASGLEPKLPHELAILIQGAAKFRDTFSPSFRRICQTQLSSELWQEPIYRVPDRIGNYYDSCNFGEEIADPVISDLKKALRPLGGFDGLTTEHFLAVIHEMPSVMAGQYSGLTFSKFGFKMLAKGAQDMINKHAQMLFDLLVFVVFAEIEVLGKDTLTSNLDTSVVFMALVEQLKRYEMMQWLAKNNSTRKEGYNKLSLDGEVTHTMNVTSPTVLETLFATDVSPQLVEGRLQSASLSDTIQDLLVWTIGGNDKSVTFDQVPVHILCNLLKDKDTELASDFLPFQPCTPWAMYIRGRLHLSRGEAGQPTLDYPQISAGYLKPEEAAHFGQGLPFYYRHIYQLFQSASCPSHTIRFAQLALQLTPQSSSIEPDTPLLRSLFHSSLEISDIQTAFTALTRLPQDNQTNLVPRMVSMLLGLPEGPSRLLDLPWPPHLHGAIDRYLADQSPSELKLPPKPATSPERQRKILVAWRLRHGDFRGAAAALYLQLQITQKHSKKSSAMPKFRLGGSDDDDANGVGSRELDEAYLTVINLMACIDNEQDRSDNTDGQVTQRGGAWLLNSTKEAKRRVVTISDVRKDWQRELDRRVVVEAGRWGFGMETRNEEGMDSG